MGWGWGWIGRWGKREIKYLSLHRHRHHRNDSCIQMGSNESHFNVSLIARDKVTRQCPQTTTFLKRKESHKCFINCERQTPPPPPPQKKKKEARRQCRQTTTFLKRKESHKCFVNCEGQSQKTVSTNHNLQSSGAV